MADSTSGNSEELKLKITPELDQAALEKVKKQMEDIPSEIPMGSKKTGKGNGDSDATKSTKAQTSALKELLAAERLRIDQADLTLRKTRANAQAEIQTIRDRAAVGKITMQEMNNQILLQENIIENANASAIQSYQEVGVTLDNLLPKYKGNADAQQLIVNRQKQLFYANQRASNGFVSMSDSMQTMVSQTKNANLAFMNFGRIVQDAPFGLIGIANNIDPLLMSLSVLSNEIDINTQKVRGFGGSLKALGAQLLGPAGIIFLLGSALPSILLVLQRRQQEVTKESDAMAEALKKVADEFGRLAAEAAGEEGIQQLNAELKTTTLTLDAVNIELEKVLKNIDEQASAEAIATGQAREYEEIKAIAVRRLQKENDLLINNLKSDKQLLETNKQQLEAKRNQLGFEERMGVLQEEHGIAASLSLDQQIKKQKQLNDLRLEALEILDPIQAEIEKEQQRVIELITKTAQSATSATSAEASRTILELRKYYDGIEKMIRDKNKETGKEIKANDDRLFKTREEFLKAYGNFTLGELQKRVNAEKETLKEILDSEFATSEERLNATRVYEQNVLDIKREFLRKFFDESIKMSEMEAQKRKEAFERIKSPLANQSSLEDDRARLLTWAEATGDELFAIDVRRDQALADLRKQFHTQEMQESIAFKNAEFSIVEKAENEKQQLKLDKFTEVFQAAGELASATAELIFGESKAGAIAQVIIDTAMGIQKIWANSGMNPVVGGLLTSALAAKGIVAIRKINSTKVGSKSIDSSQTSASTTREVMAEGIGPRAGQIISPYGTIMSASAQPQNNVAMPDISIDARVDRRGLAIAVREGEQEIRTQQFSYT